MPGTQLDTSSPSDKDAILDWWIGERQSTQDIYYLMSGLYNQQGKTEFEQRLLGELELGYERRSGVDHVYQKASQEKGVWTQATIRINGVTVHRTQPARSRRENEGTYAMRGTGIHPVMLEDSMHDSEVETLERMSNFIFTQDLSAINQLHIILSGSMGPCTVCQARFEEFVKDLRNAAKTRRASFFLIFEVNYTTRTHTKKSPSQQQITYGYTGDRTETVGRIGYQYNYWNKTFTEKIGGA